MSATREPYRHDETKRRYIIVDRAGRICGLGDLAGTRLLFDTHEIAMRVLLDCREKRPGDYVIVAVTVPRGLLPRGLVSQEPTKAEGP